MAPAHDYIGNLEEKIDRMNSKEGLKSLTKVSYANTERNCGLNEGQEKQMSKVLNFSDETNQDSSLKKDHKNYIRNYSYKKEKSQSVRSWRQSEARGSSTSHYVKWVDEEYKPTLSWRDRGSQNSLTYNTNINKEKPSNVLSWRDPGFRRSNIHLSTKNDPKRYENNHVKDRKKTPNDRIAYIVGSNDRVGQTVGSHDIIGRPDASYNKSLRLEGYFRIICDTINVDNEGLTELDNVWNTLEKIYSESPGLFVRPPCKKNLKTNESAEINCYTFDCSDTSHIAKVAKILREKLWFYEFTILYFDNQKVLYMSTYDGELYKQEYLKWKIYIEKNNI